MDDLQAETRDETEDEEESLALALALEGTSATGGVTAPWSVANATDEIDPATLGVPCLRTVEVGARVEILWSHGGYAAASNPTPNLRRSAPHRKPARPAGWEPGTIKECTLQVDGRKGAPVVFYRLAYDDGTEARALSSQPPLLLLLASRQTLPSNALTRPVLPLSTGDGGLALPAGAAALRRQRSR